MIVLFEKPNETRSRFSSEARFQGPRTEPSGSQHHACEFPFTRNSLLLGDEEIMANIWQKFYESSVFKFNTTARVAIETLTIPSATTVKSSQSNENN